MSDSGFLEDGFKDLQKQREMIKEEAHAKRRAGFTQVKALDPMDGNKLKNMWVKKDDATLGYEAEQAKKKELSKRHQEIARKRKILEMAKYEAELKDQEKELEKIEKDLHRAGIKSIEDKHK